MPSYVFYNPALSLCRTLPTFLAPESLSIRRPLLLSVSLRTPHQRFYLSREDSLLSQAQDLDVDPTGPGR